jgi:hypothetical protein
MARRFNRKELKVIKTKVAAFQSLVLGLTAKNGKKI